MATPAAIRRRAELTANKMPIPLIRLTRNKSRAKDRSLITSHRITSIMDTMIKIMKMMLALTTRLHMPSMATMLLRGEQPH